MTTMQFQAQADALSEAIFGHSINASFDSLVEGTAKRRKGSVLALERVFYDAMLDADVVLEIGGNDGRHTQKFLNRGVDNLHAFEPNAFLGSHWIELASDERVTFNTFALGDQPSIVADFFIPKGDDVTGVSSLNPN